MGSFRILLFVVMGVAAASVLTLGNPLTPEDLATEDEDQDQGQGQNQDQDYSRSLETEEDPYNSPHQISPYPRQLCQMNLLARLKSLCRSQAATPARNRRTIFSQSEPKPHPPFSQTGSTSGSSSSLWSRNENVVDACCKKSCHISKLLSFCPSFTSSFTSTTTETPVSISENTPSRSQPLPQIDQSTEKKERQSPLLPILIGLLALGLPKKSKEQFPQPASQPEMGHGQGHPGRRTTLEIDVILERQELPSDSEDQVVKVAQLSPAPAPPPVSNGCGNKRPSFGKPSFPRRKCDGDEGRQGRGQGQGQGQDGRQRMTSSNGRERGEESIREPDPKLEIGTHFGTRDGGRH